MNTYLSYAPPSIEERVAFLLDLINGRVVDNGSGCLVWAARHPGRLRIDGRRVMLTAAIWQLEHPGEPTPKMVTTSCGTHHCIEPSHLVKAESAFGGLNAERHRAKLARLEREAAEERSEDAGTATHSPCDGDAETPDAITAAGAPATADREPRADVSAAAHRARQRTEAVRRVSEAN